MKWVAELQGMPEKGQAYPALCKGQRGLLEETDVQTMTHEMRGKQLGKGLGSGQVRVRETG